MRQIVVELRKSMITVLVTVFLSLCSAAGTTWLAVHDLRQDYVAFAEELKTDQQKQQLIEEQNRALAIETSRLSALVEQLSRQVSQLNEHLLSSK